MVRGVGEQVRWLVASSSRPGEEGLQTGVDYQPDAPASASFAAPASASSPWPGGWHLAFDASPHLVGKMPSLARRAGSRDR